MKILILESNLRKDLDINQEICDLREAIDQSPNPAQFQFEVERTVKAGDLQRLLLKHQPQIVHFCGHGSGDQGLVFADDEGKERRVETEALARLFRLCEQYINCVLLNACYSEVQADAIVEHIDYVIGMQQAIDDRAAIAFSQGFYLALGYDRSIEEAYEFGCNAIQLKVSSSSRARSAVSEEQRKFLVDEAIETTVLREHLKPILRKRPTLLATPNATQTPLSTELRLTMQLELDKVLEEEATSQYRSQVKDYLADHQLEPFEQVLLDQLRDELGLSIEETDRILAEEQAPILQARQAYEQRLTALIQFYPFNEAIVAELKRFQERRNLTDAEVADISQPIFAAAESAHRASLEEQAALQAALQAAQKEQEQEEKRQRYRQEFYRATEAAYPIADSIRLALKSFQQQIGLSDEAAEAIEQPILARLEAEHQERLRQRESDRLRREAQERQRRVEAEQAESDRLRREAQQAESDRLRREKAERQQQQAEADRLRREAQEPFVSFPTSWDDYKEADRRRREAQERQRQEANQPAGGDRYSSTLSRRRVIQAAIGVAGTGIAVAGGRLLQQQTSSVTVSPQQAPAVTANQRQTSSVTINDKGEVIDRHPVQPKIFTKDLGNGITLEMVQIPGGKFPMGSEKEGDTNESPQHSVTVQPFAMGRFEVTQAQWKAIASLPKVKIDLNADPSNFKGSDRPVEQVSWNDAIEFCDRLSAKTGKKCRLPSEAEWEYACRAGTTTPFNVGATLSTDLANYDGEQTIAVGSFPPNAFGLYDMHGNVWEWCTDYYHSTYQGAPTDGSAWVEGGDRKYRMLRGGSWFIDPWYCRSVYRYGNTPDIRGSNFGFRVCLPFREDLT